MNAIATCDKKHRLIVRDAIPGNQYLVQGLSLKPVEEPKPAEAEKVVYGKLAEKDGVMVFDFGVEFDDEELGRAIVEGLRQDREAMS